MHSGPMRQWIIGLQPLMALFRGKPKLILLTTTDGRFNRLKAKPRPVPKERILGYSKRKIPNLIVTLAGTVLVLLLVLTFAN